MKNLRPLELWVGPECSVTRIGDDFRDQMKATGHASRISDIDAFAQAGARAVRYPILWEQTAPDENGEPRWDFADERLGAIRSHGLRPIVGLLHHGSGPRHTDLLDPEFPRKLARYAASVARRFPWIDAWTPVNEPLTTSRFSGLYGFG